MIKMKYTRATENHTLISNNFIYLHIVAKMNRNIQQAYENYNPVSSLYNTKPHLLMHALYCSRGHTWHTCPCKLRLFLRQLQPDNYPSSSYQQATQPTAEYVATVVVEVTLT